MAPVRIRRQGTSTAVTLSPRTLTAARLREGDLVEQAVNDRGEVVLTPVRVTARIRPEVAEIVDRVIEQDRKLLDRLAARVEQSLRHATAPGRGASPGGTSSSRRRGPSTSHR